jgi:Protein of unknown function (DUF3987)/Bifunctional DNA primase/polymerase, N-terminal
MNFTQKTAAATSLDAVLDYRRRGWAIVPIPAGEKAPRIPDWPKLRLQEDDLPAHFSNSKNVGVILGVASNGLVDVDLDCPEALAVADFFLAQTSSVFGRPSKSRSHRLYRCEPLPVPRKFSAPDGATLAELRANGQQTLVPPSTHPSGETISWNENEDPAGVNADDLHRAVSKLAAAALLARHWPQPGQRHNVALALAGMLIRGGWAESETENFVRVVAAAAGDEESHERMRDGLSTARQLRAGKAATGAPTLAQIVGSAIVERVRDWLGFYTRIHASKAIDWSDPVPLGDELRSVCALDFEFLPQSFRPLIEDISERMQAPPDYAAAAVIVALAGCVNRRAVILPKREDPWQVVPNLWGAIVAPPGMMKSPILRAMTQPLARIEEKWRAEYESATSDFEGEKEAAELRYQAWREQYKQAVKKGAPPPIQPDRTLSPPPQRRLVLTDATFEKLHEILSQNPAGVLVVRDELTGWLSELGRLGREGERAFFLQAWNGDSGFTVDRIGRGSTYVPACCVSLLGNIQPARLRSYLSDAIEGGPTDDGLFQRFQILVWPDPPRVWELIDRRANDTAIQKVENIFSTLTELSPDLPVRMNFAPDAQELFFAWLSNLEHRIRGDSGLAPFFIGHLAKYRKLMPSLAGLFELADKVAACEALSSPQQISLEHARQAAALCDYLESHAHRTYACIVSPETRSARELVRHIQGHDLAEQFTTREIYRHGWAGLDTPERVRGALFFLEELAWLRRAESPESLTGGRPPELWIVNPKVQHA